MWTEEEMTQMEQDKELEKMFEWQCRNSIRTKNDQSAKVDSGKPQLSLVPMDILEGIARVREYGNRKYGDPENWKTVEAKRYVDAMLRHAIKFAEDPIGLDEESKLPHLWHLACNVAFLCWIYKPSFKLCGK